MKLRQTHVKTLKNEVQELHAAIPIVLRDINNWLMVQKEREDGGSVDAYHVTYTRERLEVRLTRFRERLGNIYDLMSERGMRQTLNRED